MIKALKTFWLSVKDTVLFLVQYRQRKRQSEEQIAELECQLATAQIGMYLALIAETKARKNK